MRGRTIQKGMNHMAKTAGTTESTIPTHMLLAYVRDLLEQIQEGLDHRSGSSENQLATISLTHPKNTIKLGCVKAKEREEEASTMDTTVLDITPYFAKHHTVTIVFEDEAAVHMHKCGVCGDFFETASGTRNRCPHCNTRNWRTGRTKWDQRRALRRAKQAQ